MPYYNSLMGFASTYMSDFASQVVAESGNWKDGYHLGKLIFKSLKEMPKDTVLQINGDDGETRTAGEILKKSMKCAAAMKDSGLKLGDVVMILAPNHLDVVVPIYACLFNGLKVCTVDRFLRGNELAHFMKLSKPSMILCQNEKVVDLKKAVEMCNLNVKIVTFDESHEYLTFERMLEESDMNIDENNFMVSNFDPEEIISFLLTTSGTTGLPKCAAISHKNILVYLPYLFGSASQFPKPVELILVLAPTQWLSALAMMLISPIFRTPTLTTTKPPTEEWVTEIITTYKASFTVFNPPFANTLSKYCLSRNIKLPSFEFIIFGGSAVNAKCLDDIKTVAPNAIVGCAYGMSETGILFYTYDAGVKLGMNVVGPMHHKLVDVVTGKEITEPNVPGELRLKGPNIFKEYYNNPEATKEAFSEDGWFKTGDLLYLNETKEFIFFDRLKILLKYKSYQISPTEIEAVIANHPQVLETAVTGVPDLDGNDLVVAVIVVKSNAEVSAQEIKDLVKDNLSDSKQIRGGVIFVEKLPKTATGKIDRSKLKQLAKELNKE